MPRPKAQFKGDGTGSRPKDFSVNLRDRLRQFFIDIVKEEDLGIDDSCDSFVEAVLTEARFAIDERHWLNYEITKQELRAEHSNLSRILASAQKKLRSKRKIPSLPKDLTTLQHNLQHLSLEYERLLGVDADHLGCADKIGELLSNANVDIVSCTNKIQEMLDSLNDVESKINQLETKPKPVEKQHEAALEMAIRVLRILKSYGIKPSSTWDGDLGYVSNAVLILKFIGDDICLYLAESTWRDTIRDAKKAAPDLR